MQVFCRSIKKRVKEKQQQKKKKKKKKKKRTDQPNQREDVQNHRIFVKYN